METSSSLAGKAALPEMLVDVNKLKRAYFDCSPNAEGSNQLVHFGTSGHRGSSLKAKCVVCHGPKGEKKFDADKKEDELIEITLKGKKTEKPPNMPAYEAKGLTADQAKELIAYMKTLKTQ